MGRKKPSSRFKGKTVDLLRAGEDGFVRAEILNIVEEVGEWGYLIRYVDNDRVAFLAWNSVVEISESFQKKANVVKFPRLKAVKPKQ